MKRLLSIFALLFFALAQLAHAQLPGWIPPYPYPDYVGGNASNYPVQLNVKTCCGAVGDGTTDDYSAITNAVRQLTNYSSLYFPSGTYVVRSPLKLGSYHGISFLDKPHQWIGDGGSNTILRGELTGALNSTIYARGGQYSSTDNMIASGATKGSSNLVMFSVTGLAVGDTVRYAMTNDATRVWGWTPSGSSDDSKDGYCAMGGIAKIFAISGTNVTLDCPIIDNLTNGAPFLREFAPFRDFGLRDIGLSITNTDSSAAALYIYGLENFWASNVFIHSFGNYGFQFHKVHRGSFRFGWIKDSFKKTSSVYGGQVLTGTSSCVFEHNRFGKASAGFVFQGAASGNYVGANYFYETFPYDWRGDGPQDCLAGGILFHGFGPHNNWVEFNVVGKIEFDNVWGINRENIINANWVTRSDPTLNEPDTMTNCISGIEVESTNRFVIATRNVVGLGAQSGSGKLSWDFSQAMTNGLFFFENFTFEDGTTNTFYGGTSPSHPDSFRYGTNKPSEFGSCPFPPFGPQVLYRTNSWPPIPAVALHYGINYSSIVYNTNAGPKQVKPNFKL